MAKRKALRTQRPPEPRSSAHSDATQMPDASTMGALAEAEPWPNSEPDYTSATKKLLWTFHEAACYQVARVAGCVDWPPARRTYCADSFCQPKSGHYWL